MRPYSCLFLLCTALLGCRSSSFDAPPIEHQNFARLYAELLVLAADDSTASLAEAPAGERADSILERAGVSREDYMETVRWYNEDVSRWRELLAEVVVLLEQRAARADSVLKSPGESATDASPGGPAPGEPRR